MSSGKPGPTPNTALPDIQALVEQWYQTHQGKIHGRETAYQAQHGGRYWQGILTPDVAPDDGAEVVADFTRKPTDQVDRWADIFKGGNKLPDSNPCQLRLDVYDGPSGCGYVLTLTFTKAARTWARSWNTGPDTGRETGWVDVTPPPEIVSAQRF